MAKLQRTYTMSIQGRSGQFHEVSYPLTCVFDMDLRAGSGANSAHFMLYNLSPAVRDDVQFDSAIDIDGRIVLRRSVVFNAGYQSEGALPIVFQGNIQKAFFYRDGPDVVTDIVVMDGLDAIQKSMVALSRATPWTGPAEVARLTSLLNPYGVTLGAIGTLFADYQPKRGAMWLGSTWENLKRLAAAQGGCASICKEKLYMMGPDDALATAGDMPTLDDTTGLIGTPRRSGWTIDAQMLFEPKWQLWQLMKLAVRINPSLNSIRRIDAIGHRGTISGAKDGGALTSLSLYLSDKNFNLVTPA